MEWRFGWRAGGVINDVAVLLGGGGMGGGGALHRIGDTNHDVTSESTAPALCRCGNCTSHVIGRRTGSRTRCVLHISMGKQSLRCDRCSSVMTTEFGRGRMGMGSRAGDGVWVRVDDLQRR